MQTSNILPKSYLETEQCEIPDRLEKDPIDEPWFDDTDPKSPLSPRSPVRTCTALLQSGAKKGQPCGKPIVRDELCKRHLNQPPEVASSDQKPSKRPRITEYVKGRCVCKTQKGLICGALVKDGGLMCKRHANCPIPDDYVEVVQVQPTEEDEEEPEIILPDTMEVEEEKKEIEIQGPPLEASLFGQREWSIQYVESPKEMMQILRSTQVVDIAEEQLRLLESKIHQCFQ